MDGLGKKVAVTRFQSVNIALCCAFGLYVAFGIAVLDHLMTCLPLPQDCSDPIRMGWGW